MEAKVHSRLEHMLFLHDCYPFEALNSYWNKIMTLLEKIKEAYPNTENRKSKRTVFPPQGCIKQFIFCQTYVNISRRSSLKETANKISKKRISVKNGRARY